MEGKHFFGSNQQERMPASLSESLKRRREEHQLAMHLQCEDQPRHRCSRTDARSLEIRSGLLYVADRGGSTDPVKRLTDSSVRVPWTPLLSSIRGIHESGTTICTDNQLCPNAASAHGISTLATLSSAKLSSFVSVSDRLSRRTHNDSTMTFTLRPFRVAVMRGDSGRRCAFLLHSTFAYTWHRRNTFMDSADGEQAGFELQETVRCRVSSSTVTRSSSSTVRPTTATNGSTSSTSDSTTAPGAVTAVNLFERSPDHLSHNEEASCGALRSDMSQDVLGDGYTYEATQVSRCRSIPRCVADLEESTSSLGSYSPALFVDCLIKCAQEEAAITLDDRHGWVHLYHGRHITTEVGRTHLLKDILALSNFGAESANAPPSCSEPPSVTICMFRKC
ncbi:hypothetical protein, conserved [Leishmania tarentolae]|uniref:Uncharacterized protein n=1 Tax=Leishmania tarentolae TaxID=5689 RepID=A0A640KTF6_LEITA|nr:hypothetical protein, conserved [Leishmania tarentolae]